MKPSGTNVMEAVPLRSSDGQSRNTLRLTRGHYQESKNEEAGLASYTIMLRESIQRDNLPLFQLFHSAGHPWWGDGGCRLQLRLGAPQRRKRGWGQH